MRNKTTHFSSQFCHQNQPGTSPPSKEKDIFSSSKGNISRQTLSRKILPVQIFQDGKEKSSLESLTASLPLLLNEHCGFNSAFSCLHARHTLGWHRVSQLKPTTSLHLHSQQQQEKAAAVIQIEIYSSSFIDVNAVTWDLHTPK